MGRKRADNELAGLFFRRLLVPALQAIPDSHVELRVFDVETRKPTARLWTRSADAYAEFCAEHSDGSQPTSVYHGVAVRQNNRGTKADLLGTSLLWSEIDTDLLGWEMQDVVVALHRLPDTMRPTACINSGHGIHVYWLLREPLQAIEQIEDANKVLQRFVSGDNVWNADRVLRVPGTWNRKHGGKKFCEPIFLHHWRTFDASDLIDAVLEFERVLNNGKWITHKEADALAASSRVDEDKAHTIATEDSRKKTNARGLKIWERCKYGGGVGYVGIDEAIMLYTAHLYVQLVRKNAEPLPRQLDAIVQDTLERVKDVHARDAAGERWDWQLESREIRSKLNSWIKKWTVYEAKAPRKRMKGIK